MDFAISVLFIRFFFSSHSDTSEKTDGKSRVCRLSEVTIEKVIVRETVDHGQLTATRSDEVTHCSIRIRTRDEVLRSFKELSISSRVLISAGKLPALSFSKFQYRKPLLSKLKLQTEFSLSRSRMQSRRADSSPLHNVSGMVFCL